MYRYFDEGYIGTDNEVLYDIDSLEHLSIPARQRLAEIESEHFSDLEFGYLDAERILIAEGLYKPDKED